MAPDSQEGMSTRIRTLELEFMKLGVTVANIENDVHDIKEDNKEAAQKVDDRLGGITKLLWGAVFLLFSGFISALGILVSQGGIH